MKTNKFRFSWMAMAALLTAGCAQNDELEETVRPSSENALNVTVTEKGFENIDGTSSRVATEEYTTTFEDGDKIGVYVVDNTGKVLVNNLSLQKSNDAWTGNTLYYYPDADYIAYFPYAEMPDTITCEDGIVDYFKKTFLVPDQSSEAAYEAADLMTAVVPAGDVVRGTDSPITFAFSHKMSMIELKVPVRKYVTASEGGWEYSAPLGDVSFKKDEVDYSLFPVGGGVYRCIVAPEENMKIKGSFYDGTIPVYFPKTDDTLPVSLSESKYKQIAVKYEGISDEPEERALAIGDYYYADGSIWPGDVEGAPSNNCIGIIFKTETSDTDKGNGWKHGYVMSLFDTADESIDIKWATNNTTISNLPAYEKNETSITTAFSDFDGYKATQTILTGTSADAYPAAEAAVSYEVELPDGTSGWYLPSIGQIAAIINMGASFGTKPESTFTPQNAFDTSSGKFDENRGAPEAMLALQEKLQSVGGEFYYYPISENQSYSYRWWTSAGDLSDNTKAWSIDMNSYKFLLYNAGKTTTNDVHVRPVFAF